MKWVRLLAPEEFTNAVRSCSIIVAHAGTGSFFLAAQMAKPIVMVPRLAANHEHTTDHQLHTLERALESEGEPPSLLAFRARQGH